jgi:hypothetical protein
MIQFRWLNSKNIFLFDAVGAALSLVVTGGILPFFSQTIGIPRTVLYCLAFFPLVFGLYSFVCYQLPARKAWMLLAIVFANFFYSALSLGLLLLYPGITLWGYLFLGTELLVLSVVIAIEWATYKRHFDRA